MKVKLTIAFDGNAYEGWSSQRAAYGVRHAIEQAWQKTLGADPQLVSSSRTDSGVHAHGLVAHAILTNSKIPIMRLPGIINAALPDDVRILRTELVADDFDARFHCRSKEYRYTIWNDPIMEPLLRHQAWHVKKPLGQALMLEAARLLSGTHDFRSFTLKRDGELGSSVRSIQQLRINGQGKQISIHIIADGFLYKMCRALVGTLVQVGTGKMTLPAVLSLLDQPQENKSGLIAPAHGLVLWKVRYD